MREQIYSLLAYLFVLFIFILIEHFFGFNNTVIVGISGIIGHLLDIKSKLHNL